MTSVRRLTRLSDVERERVHRLAAEVEEFDGVAALSEQFLLDLRPGSGAGHLLAEAHGRLVGYAQLAEPGMPSSAAELLVAPGARRQGVGRALLGALPRDVRVWAHGDLPVARAFAAALGLTTVRELHRMVLRFAPEPLEEPTLPPGLRVRTFRPGLDDAAWVAVNAVTFASHPEQGRLTLADLHERMAQPWFDPDGFFLVVPVGSDPLSGKAQPDPPIAAFHWTKAPPAQVYVVGVHPAYQGAGLGRAVVLLGLHHLRSRGFAEVSLYTDGDNVPAVRTYRRLGFTTVEIDRMLAFPAVAEDATMTP